MPRRWDLIDERASSLHHRDSGRDERFDADVAPFNPQPRLSCLLLSLLSGVNCGLTFLFFFSFCCCCCCCCRLIFSSPLTFLFVPALMYDNGRPGLPSYPSRQRCCCCCCSFLFSLSQKKEKMEKKPKYQQKNQERKKERKEKKKKRKHNRNKRLLPQKTIRKSRSRFPSPAYRSG